MRTTKEKYVSDQDKVDRLISILGSYEDNVFESDIENAKNFLDEKSDLVKADFPDDIILLNCIFEMWALIQLYDIEFEPEGWEGIVKFANSKLSDNFQPKSPRLIDMIVHNDFARHQRNKKIIKIILTLSFWGVVIGYAFSHKYINDYYAIQNANPTVLAMVKSANMANDLEVAFIQANPELDNASQISTNCPNIASHGSYVEQGCYEPSSHSPDGREHIYIRQFTDARLTSEQNVVAAHEALHALYDHMSTTDRAATNSFLDSQYSNITDAKLTARMAIYNSLEPGERDNELHSILGTEQQSLNSDLETYYSKYFTDRQSIVADSQKVERVFSDTTIQLTALSNQINADKANETQLYQNSVYEAGVGNAYMDDYYYNQYSTLYDSISNSILSYNSQCDDYNSLAADFNGKSFSTIPIQGSKQ